MDMRLFFIILFGLLRGSHSLGGVFELRLTSFSHPSNRDTTGLCCSPNEEGNCRTECTPKFRICVKNYQVSIDPSGGCFFGETLTDVVEFGTNKKNSFHFPFNFRWPGTFSLIIEAFQPQQLFQYQMNNIKNATSNRLLSRLAIQQYLDISEDWKSRQWNDTNVVLKYEYRVRCLPDYYGEACDKTCRPRDDKFGHYECGEGGDIKCLEGWRGEYCEVAICTPGCSPTSGSCTTPSTCTCHNGWEGPTCTSCTRYPGCKHGRCSKPFQCECEEGWGGLFCNQDLNYCTNHKPCLNGGTCFNTGQGSYTCECPEGWAGGECEYVSGGGRNICGCGNGGVCRDNGTSLFCDCPEPFSGPKCMSQQTNSKKPACPCLNNGTCTNSTACNCPPGFSGQFCEIIQPCNCLNNGQCINSTCRCPLGFTDPTCSTIINICATLPCANGGSCINLPKNEFKCECKIGFTGVDCSEKCGETCLLSIETEELREELTTQHVVIVVVVSVATPLMVVVAVAVVVLLKKRKEEERRRNDAVAREQNERNCRKLELQQEYNSGGGGSRDKWNKNLNNNKKMSNLDLSGECGKPQPPPQTSYNNTLPHHHHPPHSSPLLLDPYNPPPQQPHLLLQHPTHSSSHSHSSHLSSLLSKSSPQTSPVILNKLHDPLIYDLNLATEV